jgi:hypothetical protein
MGSIFHNASPIRSFSCPSSSTFTSTLADDATKVQVVEELQNAKKSSSICKFRLLDCILVS